MAKQMTAFIPQSPQKASDLLHGSLTELPPQVVILFSDKDHIQKRWAITNNIVVGLNNKLATGELKDLSAMCEDQDIDVRDDESDESVGLP